MWTSTPPNYWQIVMTHEAGHAVAALAVHDVAADIFIKATSEGSSPFTASHRYKTSLMEALSDDGDTVGAIVIMAAGAKAEAICLGITESAGFPGDRAKINNLRSQWENKCTEAFGRSLPLPEEAIQKELSRNTERLTKLKGILDEIGSNYERTATVVTENRKALEVIAAEAYRNIQSIGEQNLSDGQILLTAEQIREIWNTDRGRQ